MPNANAQLTRAEDIHFSQGQDERSTTRKQLHEAVDLWLDQCEPLLDSNWRPISATQLMTTEKRIWSAVLMLGGLIMALILKGIANEEAFQHECNRHFRNQNKGKWKSRNARPVRVQTRFGNWVKLRTSHLYPRKKGRGRPSKKKRGISRSPFLIQMGCDQRVTPFLASEMAREVTEGPSYAAAAERFIRDGFKISKQRLRRITKAFAEKTDALIEGILNGEKESIFPSAEGMLVSIQADGGRVKLSRKKKGRRKKGGKRAGRHTEWREPCLILIKLVDPVTGKAVKIYDATLRSWKQTFRLLESYLRVIEIHKATEIQFICDGARHLWRWDGAIALFQRLELEDRVHFTLDFYHATQRIWAISTLIKSWKDDKARKRWVHTMIGYMRRGQIDRVIDAISTFRRGRNAGLIGKKVQYLIDHRDHLNYAELKEKGLALGSGEVESAMRRVVNLRLKGNAMLWSSEMVEGLLTLRSYLKAGWWEKLAFAVAKEDELCHY